MRGIELVGAERVRKCFACCRVPSTARRPFLTAAPCKDFLVPRRVDLRCVSSIKTASDEFSARPRWAFCAGRATLLQVAPSGAAGGRFQRRCVTPPQVGNLQFRAEGSFTAALWESSETSVGVSLRRELRVIVWSCFRAICTPSAYADSEDKLGN